MAFLQSNQLDPELRVFRLAPNGRDLSEIPPSIWQQIINHERPLQPANGSVKVLLLQLTPQPTIPSARTERLQPTLAGEGHDSAREPDTACKRIDALRLQTDEFGFLLTWDATGVSGTRGGTPSARLVDASHLFLRRYLSHRHSWQPEPALLNQALQRVAPRPDY